MLDDLSRLVGARVLVERRGDRLSVVRILGGGGTLVDDDNELDRLAQESQARDAAYRNAVEVAKAEFDELFPHYKQVRDRIGRLRQLITAGHELLEIPLQPDDEYHYRYDSFMSAQVRANWGKRANTNQGGVRSPQDPARERQGGGGRGGPTG